MAAVIPDKKVEQVEFCEAHAPVWTAQAANIGLVAGQCTAFAALTTAARKAYNDAQAAKNAYRAAVTNQNSALAAAISGTGGAADLIRFIKSFAEASPDAGVVYGKAQIPPPATPTPAPAPGQPSNITVSLESSGAVTLRWKAVHAAANAGTFFSVQRKLSGEKNFSLVGNTGTKSFTDSTLTQGTPGTTYIIQGHRGLLVGVASEQVSVQFGVGGDGLVGAISASNATVKMAA